MNPAPPEDETPATASLELVTRAQAGDDAARERLFARYWPRVFRVVRARMGRRLRALHEPEDLVQQTFLSALSALGRFEAREDAALIDWFARLTENQIKDAAKYHAAEKRDAGRLVPLRTKSDDDSTSRLFEPASDETPPLERLARAEEARQLDECIAELPADEREALILRDHADASWALIATTLGRPSEGAARELYRRAQVRLMGRLAGRLGEEGT